MTPGTITESIPIRTDEHGRMRVGDTRVLLDLVIYSGSTRNSVKKGTQG